MPEADHVRPDVRAFLDYINALPGPTAPELGHVIARQRLRASRDLADLDDGPLAMVRDIMIPRPDDSAIPGRLFDARAQRPPGPLVIYYHGGGFVLGDLDTHAPLCAEIARALDLPVVAIDYRLAPEHPFPAAPDDAEAAARWIAANGHVLGRVVTGLVLAGDSAGGMLAIVTALALRDDPAARPVLANWLAYPAADMGTRYPSYTRYGAGHVLTRDMLRWYAQSYAADLDDWRAAPLKADLAGLPRTLVTTAALDPLRDEGRAFAAALIKAGVPTIFREAEGMIHGFLSLRRILPSARDDLAAALAALGPLITEAAAAERPATAEPLIERVSAS